MTKICGTCKYVGYKYKKDGSISTEGYCYGVPPQIGQMRAKVYLSDKGCVHYTKGVEEKAETNIK